MPWSVRASGPKPSLQFLARNHAAWRFQQDNKNFKRLLLKLNLDAVLAQLTSLPVKFEISKTG